MKNFFSLFFVISALFAASPVSSRAQSAEVTVSLNERFFDALLDAVFTNLKAPSFPLALNDSKFKVQSSKFENGFQSSEFSKSSFAAGAIANRESQIENSACDETIRLQREVDGVKTAVRFRDGRIFVPIAFSGSYNPPFVGCIDFQGYAETNVELEYDREKQILIGRAKVLNVVLSGTNGVGSALVTKLVQSAIDKKINPIRILQTEKLSFAVPVENAGGALRMRATDVRAEIVSGALNVRIAYEFVKL